MLVLWTLFAVPVIGTGILLHQKLQNWEKKCWNIMPKCLSTWMVVFTGVWGLCQTGDIHAIGKQWILPTLLLFLLADALLEVKFFWGMGAFAAGHIFLIGWILSKSRFYLTEIILWLILMGLCLILFWEELKGAGENPKLYAMLLYPAVLMGMTVLALSLPFRLGKEYGWMALGAVLFAVSDMMVGKSFFHEQTKGVHYLALALYYSGIYCFALMMWT